MSTACSTRATATTRAGQRRAARSWWTRALCLRTRAATGVKERLAVAISVRMEFWHEQINLYRLLLTVGREPQHKRQTHDLLRLGHAYFVGILKEGLEAGEIAGTVDLDTLAWAILDMVRGANERRMDNLTDRTPQEDAAAITAFALSQLGLA